MLKKIERFVNEEYVAEVVCNMCGKSVNPEKEEFVHIEKQWGYFSNKDGKTQEADFCEECWDKLCEGFKIEA